VEIYLNESETLGGMVKCAVLIMAGQMKGCPLCCNCRDTFQTLVKSMISNTGNFIVKNPALLLVENKDRR